jgi:multidrug efflux pump subunit AcrA (membrane-fusion protein)
MTHPALGIRHSALGARHSIARISGLIIMTTVLAGGCSSGTPTSEPVPGAAAGPPTVEVIEVAERPIDLTLDLPGELTPYQSVAIFPKVTGFVKAIRVDRGTRVRSGEVLAQLEAPELVAQRAEAQSKLQAAEAQMAAARAKVDASTSTYDKLKAASATNGVVAGNDLVLAEKGLEADRNQLAAVQQSVEAARQASPPSRRWRDTSR